MGEQKHPGGRPKTFSTPEELQQAVDSYFSNPTRFRKIVTASGQVIEIPLFTICGMAIHLGFVDRRSFYDYETYDEYSHIIKKARFFIEREYEELLQQGHCTGAIFALKNMGWKDHSQVDSNINVNQMGAVKIDGKELGFEFSD